MQEALFYEKRAADNVACLLCPKGCLISEGGAGFCRVRKNLAGVLYADNYGAVTASGLDPIEKKPLYHFFPGTQIVSIGTMGCNLRCGFCQNWGTVHGDPGFALATPERIVAIAQQEREAGTGNLGIAYTYSEPLVWYEFVKETARLAKKVGLKNVLITNGYINEQPLRELIVDLDAMNIDVKGFTDNYYQNYCQGHLTPVLRTVETAVAAKCHVEITNLLVPGLNDQATEIQQLVDWVASLDREIPVHFSRYHPDFEMDLPPTPLAKLTQAAQIAREKLANVYIGNAPELSEQNTYCHHCGTLLIRRKGYQIQVEAVEGGRCGNCGGSNYLRGER